MQYFIIKTRNITEGDEYPQTQLSHVTRINIWKLHNSAKKYRTGTGLQHAQLGLVSIIAVKFHGIQINGLREKVFTKNVYKILKVNIFEVPLLRQKLPNRNRIAASTSRLGIYNCCEVLSNSDQWFPRKSVHKNVYRRTDGRTEGRTDRRLRR